MDVDKVQKGAKPSFLPAFVDFDDEPLTKQGTRTQVSSLQQYECDSEDATITARLQNGCRPGEFMQQFTRISWVDSVSARPDCKAYLTDLGEWMRRLADADKSQSALPASVRKNIGLQPLK
jgi:hypothetical protein